MGERRSRIFSLLFAGAVLWGALAWAGPSLWPVLPPSHLFHRIASTLAVLVVGAAAWHDLVLRQPPTAQHRTGARSSPNAAAGRSRG